MSTTPLQSFTISFFILCLGNSSICQSVNKGVNYRASTSKEMPIKYQFESSEEAGTYSSSYTILGNHDKIILQIKVLNNSFSNFISIRIEDATSSKDSTIYISYSDEAGLFVRDKDQMDPEIDNSTYFELLLSFDDRKNFVNLHTINTGSFQKEYYRLDPVSNLRIHQHNQIVWQSKERSIREEERSKAEIKLEASIDSIERIANRELDLIYNEVRNTKSEFSNSFYCPKELTVYEQLIDKCVMNSLSEMSCSKIKTNQTLTIFIDTSGVILKALSSNQSLDQPTRALEDSIIVAIKSTKFPPYVIEIGQSKYVVPVTFDYTLDVFSTYRIENWKCKNDGTIVYYDGDKPISVEYEKGFRDIYPEVKHGSYHAYICTKKCNNEEIEQIRNVSGY